MPPETLLMALIPASSLPYLVLLLLTSCINLDSLVLAQRWTNLPDIPEGPSQYHGASILNDEVYLVGGVGVHRQVLSAVRAYNITSGEWTIKKSLPVAIHRPNMASVNGKIYVLGGLLPSFYATGRSWSYSPQDDTWEELLEMKDGEERGAAAVGVVGSKIYIAGGFKNFQAVGLTSYFDTVSGDWVHGLPLMKEPVDHSLGLAVDGGLYVLGGRNGSIETTTSSVELFVLSKGMWVTKSKMLKARAGHGGVLMNNSLILFGGESMLKELPMPIFELVGDAEECHRLPFRCDSLKKMVLPLHGMSVVAVGGTLYIAGGANHTTFGPVATHMSYSFT